MIAQGARLRQVLGTPAPARAPDEIQAAFERDDPSAVVRTLGEPFEVPCEDVAHFVYWLSGVHSPRGRAQRPPALKLRHEKGIAITWRQWYAQCGVAISIRQGCRFYRKRDNAFTIPKQLRAKGPGLDEWLGQVMAQDVPLNAAQMLPQVTRAMPEVAALTCDDEMSASSESSGVDAAGSAGAAVWQALLPMNDAGRPSLRNC